MTLRIVQVLVAASEGDAITNMSLRLDEELRSMGVETSVVAHWVLSSSLEDRVGLLDDMPREGEVDLIVYHLSIGHKEVSTTIRRRHDKLAVVYHNVTPSDHYRPWNRELADDLDLGREDLHQLASQSVVALADSDFNARELQTAGYQRIHTVPAGIDPGRLNSTLVDAPLLRSLESDFPQGYVLVVGQVLPHKRVEQCLETLHILNSTHELGLGLVVCGPHRMVQYYRALLEFSATLPFVGARFTGLVSDQHLGTYYRAASCYLGMSDHEGFCIPPVEAMAFGVPTVVKSSGAISETVGTGSILLENDSGPVHAAEAIAMIMEDRKFRLSLVADGYRRVREIARSESTEEAARLLVEACL